MSIWLTAATGEGERTAFDGLRGGIVVVVVVLLNGWGSLLDSRN